MAFFTRKQAPVPVTPEEHVYLIDTENVKSVWTLLLERMTNQDKVYVFYTMNSGSVSYEAITGILQYGKRIELVECFTGKNGLDFQLVSYLGYMIRDNEKADYCIVSDDGGYDAAVKFWEKKGIKISRKTASEVSGKPAKTSRGRGLKGLKVTASTKKRSSDPAKKEVVNSQPVKEESRKIEVPKAELVKEETQKPEVRKADLPKTESRKTERKKTEQQKPEVRKTEPRNAEPRKAEPRKIDPPKAEPPLAALPLVEVAEPQDVTELVLPKQAGGSEKKGSAQKTGNRKDRQPDQKIDQKQEAAAETKTGKKSVKKTTKKTEQKAETPAYRLVEDKLRGLLSAESPEHVEEIIKVVRKAGRPENLAEIHDGIEKIYRDDNSQNVYRTIRPHVKELFEKI